MKGLAVRFTSGLVLTLPHLQIFAAMVDLIDVNVGRVVDYLREIGELDNTFIVVMSDNGAEGQLLEAVPILAGHTLKDVIRKWYDNSFENLGNHNSFVWYGPQWASAATAPSRGLKTHTTEGGIHCPCIVRYPPLLRKKGVIAPNFTTVMDILPTLLDLAGIEHPAPKFRGRDVVYPRGKSWVPLLREPDNENLKIYNSTTDIVGWEQLGVAAVRLGDWKAVFLPPPKGGGKWELFDLSKDLGEVHDLSESYPEKLAEMIAHYETYFHETGMFDSYAAYQSALKRIGWPTK